MDRRDGPAPGSVARVAVALLMLVTVGCTSNDGGADVGRAGALLSTTTLATTTMPTTTTGAPATTAPIDATSIVMDAIAAWNTGDYDAWLAFWVVDPSEDHLFARSVMNSNEQMEVTGPCDVSTMDSETVSVLCPVFVEDDFHGTGGLTSDGTVKFLLSGDGLIVETDSTTYQVNGVCCPEWEAYNRAFHVWLAEAHPDTYEEIGPPDGVPLWYLPGYANGDAENMKIALEHVEEFVAQSDVYPLDDTGS